MRLPTADPARGVQSLGREDVTAPIRVAGAQARVADAQAGVANAHARVAQYEGAGLKALGATAQEVGTYLRQRQDAEDTLAYQKAIAEGEAEINGVAGSLKNQHLLNVADHPGLQHIDWNREHVVAGPDGAPTPQPRETVPADEVSVDLFNHAADQTYERIMANLPSRRAREKFAIEWTKLRQKQVMSLQQQNIKTRQTRLGIELEETIDAHVAMGNYDRAYEAHAQAVHSGVLSQERATSFRRRLDERVAEDKVLRDFEAASTTGDFASLRIRILEDPTLPPESKRALLTRADVRENARRAQYEKQATEAADRLESELLSRMYTGETTIVDVEAAADRMRRMGQSSNATRLVQTFHAFDRQRRQDRENTPRAVLTDIATDVASVAFPPEGRSTVEQAQIVSHQLRDQLARGLIDPTEYRQLLSDVRNASQLSYNTEEYKAVRRSMWVNIAGMEEDALRMQVAQYALRTDGDAREMLTQLGQLSRLAAAAEEDLRAHIQAKGVDADIEQWWSRNRANYDPMTFATSQRASFLSRHPAYNAYADGKVEGMDVETAIAMDPGINDRERMRRLREWKGIQ